ncbi:quinoprotein amine dehydrogenase [Duganella sp. FT135W]|uniref:Quinoprotein amine dehydrogenase n=1 Tax=Duganella flavida TaxID=2692175 RepID=A0A6L8KDM5_9BURK|nr:BACON domain-containing protein [Duganella flavida]MYM25579.1 quinoprotein amine dehydrogenase [Duganella flavida]
MLRLRPAYAAVPLIIAALLTGCGGGGGGSTGGGSTAPAASPALSFTPASVTASAVAGTSLTVNVIAAVARPSDFSGATVFASVTDANNTILPSSTVVRDSDSQYHAVLLTSPSLAAGSYTGSFNVRLCKDSACTSQFPGSPVALPYNLTVIPAGSATFSAVPAMSLDASAQPGITAPAAVNVAISATGRSWTASNGGASWLKLSAASGTGDSSLSISYDASGLAQGTYSTKLTVNSNDSLVVTLPVKLTVLPPGLVLGSNSITINAINGAAIPPQIVSLDTDNKISAGWTASSDTAWLSVSPTSGATPATTVLTVDPTIGTLASGSYTGNITITPAGLTTRKLPVTLNLSKATLATSPSTITLGGTYGRDFTIGQTLALSLNTGTLSWPWSLGTVPSWATVTATAGTINAAGTSIAVKAKPANASTGTSSALLSATAAVNGDAVMTSVLLALNKDQHKLLPAETAVAFVSTPGWSRLTRTISVADNYDSFGGMSASSDQSWLVVGVSADKLVLTADPSQLLSDTLSTATITITATDPDATAPEVIRVALWKGAAAPSAASTAALRYTNVTTDPARPYAYLHNGGAVIDVYNVYTGLKESSITGFSAHLGDMAVTPNGDTLYVVDIDNARLTAVKLSTRTISQQLPLASPGTKATRLKLIRPNGVEMLLLSDGQLFLTSSLARIGTLPLSTGGALSASSNGKRIVQQDEGNTTVTHTSATVDYAAMGGGTLFAAKLAPASHTSPGTQGADVWLSADGTRVYSAAASPKSCVIMNGADLAILGYMVIGDAAPNNIEVALDGRIFCGGAARAGSSDIYMYDSTGAKVLQQYKLSTTGKQLLPRQMAVSGDGWVVVAITDDGVVTFLPIGP